MCVCLRSALDAIPQDPFSLLFELRFSGAWGSLSLVGEEEWLVAGGGVPGNVFHPSAGMTGMNQHA